MNTNNNNNISYYFYRGGGVLRLFPSPSDTYEPVRLVYNNLHKIIRHELRIITSILSFLTIIAPS